ncbi:MAG TPA: hypothetical protein VG122_25610, partial [Gemmata sp.]|nr:hypothetical protein [Gemmata sp.]
TLLRARPPNFVYPRVSHFTATTEMRCMISQNVCGAAHRAGRSSHRSTQTPILISALGTDVPFDSPRPTDASLPDLVTLP